ncbi:cytochrome P450 [Kitasatospora sp. MAP12-15]|uniref:cytochrome P450 n=1 Tax=unclassified Kitasatospora TaxID=2633591 RepID=UPI002473FD09|nr:cytochrome P450 [Kitasatospora sp. MAP12-44]MDH6109400.1 cytochrome P450 [Kitasatospora sp. MAP12-44]
MIPEPVETMADLEPDAFPFPLHPDEFGTSSRQHRRRREECPLGEVTLPSGDHAHLVVAYEDVARVLRDRRFSRNLRYPGAPRMVSEADMSDHPDAIINHDPPEHGRFRQVIQGAFSPSQEAVWRPVVQRIVDGLLDAIAAAGPPADLVADFAAVLPISVMCALMGVPAEDHRLFHDWTGVFFATDPAGTEERLRANREFLGYVRGFLAERRRKPGEDLVDLLVAACDEEDRLSEAELIQLITALLIGGHENTAATLARGVFTLLRFPEQFAALRADPLLIGPAVEEVLRFDVPSEGAFLRVSTERTALSAGSVEAGRAVQVSIPGANRDPRHFPDPERFDLRRSPNPHLTFGLGAHFCPGAPLARLELSIALRGLVDRFPGLRLAIAPEDARYAQGALIHPLLALPVAW